MIELRRIHDDLLKKRKVLKKIDLESIFSNLYGQSFFSFFEGKTQLYDRIFTTLKDRGFQVKEDYDEEEIEPPNLRRIVLILQQKSRIDLKD